MMDPGWDIPGIAHEPSAGADAAELSAAVSSDAWSPVRGRKSGRKGRAGSVSASSGLSVGAFGRLADAASTVPDRAGTCSGIAAPGRGASSNPAPAGGSCAASAGGVQVTDPVQAIELLSAVTEFLANANPADWAEGEQADCLRALAVAEARQAAAHAKVLAAFSVPGGGLAGDGHRSPRVWLTWQTHATRKAAASKVSWMHRLTAHPQLLPRWAGRGCRCRGRSRSWTGPSRCPTRSATTPTLSCSPPPARVRRLPDLAQIAEELAPRARPARRRRR